MRTLPQIQQEHTYNTSEVFTRTKATRYLEVLVVVCNCLHMKTCADGVVV